MAGAGISSTIEQFDGSIPRNVADGDLDPIMKQLPPDREGITEMVFVRVRCTCAQLLLKNIHSGFLKCPCNVVEDFASNSHQLTAEDKVIDNIKNELEMKYLQYCDASIPLHLAAISVIEVFVAILRLRSHHPSQYTDRGASLSQAERDMLFNNSLVILKWQATVHQDTKFRGFLWNFHENFPLDGFIYILSDLQRRSVGQLADRGWEAVETIYKHRPELMTDARSTLKFALGNLTLKAWAQREQALEQQTKLPHFIAVLRAKRQESNPALAKNNVETATNQASENTVPMQDTTYTSLEQWTPAETDWTSDLPNNDSADWEYWQSLLETDVPPYLAIQNWP